MLFLAIALWLASAFLALVYVRSGALKTFVAVSELSDRMPVVDGHSPRLVRAAGIVELLGGLGVILPEALGIVPILTPVAALALAVVGAATFVVLVRRRLDGIPVAVVLVVLALFVAVGRLFVHA